MNRFHIAAGAGLTALVTAGSLVGGTTSAYAGGGGVTSPNGPVTPIHATHAFAAAHHHPEAAKVPKSPAGGGVTPNSQVNGPSTCWYYPPNQLWTTGDATVDTNDFDSTQDAQVQDSSIVGGTNSASSSATSGFAVDFSNTNLFTHVAITNTWHYRGNLSAYSSASSVPYFGGVSSGTAGFDMYVNLYQNSLGGQQHVAHESLTNNSGLGPLGGVVGNSGETVMSTAINQGDTITDTVESDTSASDNTVAASNARANADFRSGDSGGSYFSGDETFQIWNYTLAPGYTITSC